MTFKYISLVSFTMFIQKFVIKFHYDLTTSHEPSTVILIRPSTVGLFE